MSKQGLTTVLVLATAYLFALLAGVVVSLLAFPGLDVEPAFHLGWIIWNSVTVLIGVFPVAHLTAMLLLYSLFVSPARGVRGAGRRLLDAIRGPVILCTVIAMLFAVVVGLVQPWAAARRDGYLHQSRFARVLLTRADANMDQGEYARAAVDYSLYLRLIREDQDVRFAFERARSLQAPQTDFVVPDEDTSFVDQAVQEGPDAIALLARAREALEREDLFSALYYARLALALDPGMQDARITANNASERMRVYSATLAEEGARELFERKRDAVADLNAEGSGRGITAYHKFATLRSEFPDDPDVARYYPKALDAVRQVSFFLDELKQSEHFPAQNDLTFRNSGEPAIREFIHFDRLIPALDGLYAIGIEAISFDTEGVVLYHLKADYGKVMERNHDSSVAWLNMQAVDRIQRTVLLPEYLSGSREPQTSHILELRVPVDRLGLIAAHGRQTSQRGIVDLLQQARLYPEFGFPVVPVHVEIALRLLLPFSLLVFSLFAIAVGLRAHYLGRPKLFVVAAIVVLPLVLHYAMELYLYAYRVLLGFVTLSAGLPVAIGVLVASQALLLVWGLFAMAAELAAS